MKRILCLILTLSILLCLLGCREDTPTIQQPVELYYRCSYDVSNLPDSIIAPVIAEGAGYTDDIQGLLNSYLRGTSADGFEVTFPASTKILSISVQDGIANLEMNDALARLSGIDLTIACACITMTTIGLTGAQTVRIQAANETLDGAEQIVMDESCLTMLDTYTPETT